MKIQNVKGGYDFLPNEQVLRNYIYDVLKKTFEEYGFKPIETPILCYYDILSDKYDENSDILKEIYKLNDQGNRKLGLRYDLTVPFAKFIAINKNKISFPFKRYEISKVFRDGPVKVGRDREFTQCDADIVGIEGQYVEAELMSLFITGFNKLDIDVVIKYNSRNLMKGIILESGIKEELVPEVTVIIDKKDKYSEEEINNFLIEIGIDIKEINELNKYFNMNLEELNQNFINTRNLFIKQGLEEINNLEKYLKGIGIDSKCEFSIILARGQNYYTGNVFEVYERNGEIKCAIGSGGRYDKIIGNFIGDGNIYPTVGISFGLTPIYEILKDRNKEEKALIDIYIVPIDTKIESLKLANRLRNLGYKVEIEMNNRKIKKSLEYANREKIPYVIVLGNDEVSNNAFKIKNMTNGVETSIKFNEIEEKINI